MYISPKSFINDAVETLPHGEISPPVARGYQLLYYADIENRCPGCGKSHWHVGRTVAECAHCGTALPLAEVSAQPAQPRIWGHFSKTAGPVN